MYREKDRALGAFIGALLGDAAGAPLEFLPSGAISVGRLQSAVRLDGGGNMGTAPGQYTDDGEMLMCLAQGLAGAGRQQPATSSFPLDEVAAKYQAWAKTQPIDMGRTCRTACTLSMLGPGAGASMTKLAHDHSMRSEANGALMRCMAIPIWAHRLDDEAVARLAVADCALTHSNPVCKSANAAYCITVAHLIRGHAADAAVDAALHYLLSTSSNSSSRSSGADTVREWIEHAVSPACAPDSLTCPQQATIGHVKWAVQLAYYHASRGTSAQDALQDVLARGGDTDTNACICMGMVGARCGARALPPQLVTRLLEGRPYGKRPAWLCNANILPTFDALWASSIPQ